MNGEQTTGTSTSGPVHGQTTDYYDWLFGNLDATLGSRRSAELLVPMIVDLVAPASVIDVGCGIGSWLATFQRAGVTDVFGIEGEHLDDRYLTVDRSLIQKVDLSGRVTLPRRFDLALCLEVAGFIRSERAEHLVRTLTDAAPIVVFSAPIPSQDDENVQPNQQWPDYWARLFAERGHVPVDCLRRDIWDLDDVAWWYKQNAMLYVHVDHLRGHDRLRREQERQPATPPRLVHPEHYLLVRAELRKRLRTRALEELRSRVGRNLPPAVRSTIRNLRAKAS